MADEVKYDYKVEPKKDAKYDYKVDGKNAPEPNTKFKSINAPKGADGRMTPEVKNFEKPSIRVIVDDAGKVSSVNPATGEVVEHPGNFRKLVDIFDHLAGQAKETAGQVVDKTKGLLGPGRKVIAAGQSSIGRAAPKITGAAGRVALGTEVAGPIGAAAATLMELMNSSPANAGEDDKLRAMNAPEASPPVSGAPNPQEENLDNQTSAVMDKGINTASQPTMTNDAPNPRPKTPLGQDMPMAATMEDNTQNGGVPTKTQTFDRSGNPVGGQQTKGGFYPSYSKGSEEATDFRSAFAKAIAGKAGTFMWQGREYNTEMK